MPWRPLPRIAFAVCIYPFQPSSPADLPLEIGDELYIIERGGADGDWYRGYLVAPPSLVAGLTTSKGQTLEARVFSGIFPRTCVEVRELLGEADVNGDRGREEQPSSLQAGAQPSGELGINGTAPGLAVVSSDGLEKSENEQIASESTEPHSRSMSRRPISQRTSKRYARDLASQGAPGHISPRLIQLHQAAPISPVSLGPRSPGAPKPSAPVPMLKIGDESPTSESEPLVDEIASCLREWHSTNVHELLLARKYKQLDKMASMVVRLDNARKQLLHNALTMQELRRVRERTVWDLVNGNKMLRGEVIVRNPSEHGRILTADDSAIEITKLQSTMSLLDEPPTSQADKDLLHHLYVQLRSVAGNLHRNITISVSLYVKQPGHLAHPLSEAHAIDIAPRELDELSITDDKMKTLFTDLSAVDIGEGAGAGTRIYLVFKALTVEPYRTSSANDAWIPSHSQVPTMSGSTLAPSSSGSTKGGRRSFMWGQKSRKELTHMGNINERQQGTGSPGSSVQNGQSDTAKGGSNWDSPQTVKRVIGLGVLEVDELMRGSREAEHQVDILTHLMPFEDRGDDDESSDDMIKELYPTRSEYFKKCSLVKGLQVHVKAFADPDADELVKSTPTLLQGIYLTRRIGFSGAPRKPRSDIYITLKEPDLNKNSFLSHPKSGIVPLAVQSSLANLQLTLEVRREDGERIENCIYPSCNSAGHTAWRTAAVERGEKWNATIRLAIDPEDVPGCHLIMSIADVPEFPFALCWMPLWTQEAFVRDGDHSLVLYKYDEYTASMISGRGAYLALPWSPSRKKDEEVTGSVAAIKLRTYLSSTKYSQDSTLLGLLKWKTQKAGELIELLRRFVFVPELEIVKLLNEVFDALFQVLTEYFRSDENTGVDEDLVFSALIRVLSIVHDRRFNLQPLVDKYAEERFNWPFATPCLIRSFNRLLSDPADTDTSRKLRATLKVGGHVLKFIVNARNQQKEKEAGIGITGRQPVFAKDIRSIFKGLNDMMKNPAPTLIGTKTLAVQNLHVWLPELTAHMETKDILHLAVDFVNSCTDLQGTIVLYKLVLILHLAELDLFAAPEVRQVLSKQTVGWLAPYWGKTEEVTDQWKNQVRLCCSVVATQVSQGGETAIECVPKLVDSYVAIQATPRPEKASLSLLFPTSYPLQSRTAPSPVKFDEAMVEIAAVLAAIFNLSMPIQLDLPGTILSEFVLKSLQVFKSILDCDAFPRSWLSVHVYHHKSAVRALEQLSGILLESFLPDPEEADRFDTEIWRAFFDTLVKVIGSDALALETFPEQKRRAVWKIAGDVRETGADLLRGTWDAIGWETSEDESARFALDRLGGFQVQYVPALIAPIVELCLSVHQGLRGVAVGILRTMIISEWTLNEDLDIIQAEMIDCLDNLFESKPLTESILQKLFITELMDLFSPLTETPDDPLFIAVKQLIDTIDELLDLLVAVHGEGAENEAFHIVDRLHLMEFLRDMQKEDIYIRYVHQLAQLQVDAGNHTEAGLALQLHSDLYEWNPSAVLEPLKEPPFPAQTEFERKEQLYFQQIRHFEEGSSWENALGAYGELARQYEHNVFDFHKLARTQRAMATVHERIASGERHHPHYFRVVYKGLGFPNALRDKQFIFEGSPQDRIGSFTDRMQQQHPAAQILSSGMNEELEGQFLQIFPVSPQKNLNHPVYQRQKVSQSIREHHLQSRPKQFVTSSRRYLGKDSKITDVIVEKTVYTTAETFPTILRRSEVIQTNDITLDPLQAAVERTTRKTQELLILETRASENSSGLASLKEFLMTSVDPDAELSVSNYRELIPKPEPLGSDYGEDDGEPEPPLLGPMDNALRVALLDHVMIIKRCLTNFSKPDQDAARFYLTQRFETTFRPEILALAPAQQSHLSDAHQRTTSPQPSISTSTPRAPAPIPQAAASATDRPIAASPTSPSKRHSHHEKDRRSLAFLRRGGSSEKRQSSSTEASTDLSAKLNRLALRNEIQHSAVPAVRSNSTSEAGNASVDSKEPALRNRFSFRQTNVGVHDVAAEPGSKARLSQSQGTESTKTSHVSSERSGRNEASEGARIGSEKENEHSQSQERRESRPAEGPKKRFSMLGLRRKGSKGNAALGDKARKETFPEE